VTPAQAILRWHVELGNVVIPKSVTPRRIKENFDIFGFELDAEDLSAIARLDRGERTGPDPVAFG
jgi:2,5-diketo-D-gluconate reductase A